MWVYKLMCIYQLMEFRAQFLVYPVGSSNPSRLLVERDSWMTIILMAVLGDKCYQDIMDDNVQRWSQLEEIDMDTVSTVDQMQKRKGAAFRQNEAGWTAEYARNRVRFKHDFDLTQRIQAHIATSRLQGSSLNVDATAGWLAHLISSFHGMWQGSV